jgi:hypothetical protein
MNMNPVRFQTPKGSRTSHPIKQIGNVSMWRLFCKCKSRKGAPTDAAELSDVPKKPVCHAGLKELTAELQDAESVANIYRDALDRSRKVPS